jgi:hypothetical protein
MIDDVPHRHRSPSARLPFLIRTVKGKTEGSKYLEQVTFFSSTLFLLESSLYYHYFKEF